MGEQENVRTIEEFYAAFGRGDVPSLLNALAEDVDWRHPRADDIPWGGNRRGRDEISSFFAAVAQTIDVEKFEPREFVAKDDRVIVFGHEQMRVKSNGLTYGVEFTHAWTLRGGKIIRFQEYTDTATLVEALRGS